MRKASVIKRKLMQICGIDHVQLGMPAGQEEQARLFYGRVLGIPEKPKPPHLVVRGGVWFEDGTVKIHLGVEKEFRPAKKAHLALRVRGLDELVAKCQEAGFEVISDSLLEGYDRVYVSDPFGNRIELMELV